MEAAKQIITVTRPVQAAAGHVPVETSDEGAQRALARARLYHFFEIGLAHPGADGLAYFREGSTGLAYVTALAESGDADDEAKSAGLRFFTALRALDDAHAESAHIALFSTNFPHLPCPPYGSLYTVEGDKRLDEMRAIKEFYSANGIDMDESFTDLPDHLCVELEFLQVLCFREQEAELAGDANLDESLRLAEAQFLERFALPFLMRIARLGVAQMPDNPYTHLLVATRAFVQAHAHSLGIVAAPTP